MVPPGKPGRDIFAALCGLHNRNHNFGKNWLGEKFSTFSTAFSTAQAGKIQENQGEKPGYHKFFHSFPHKSPLFPGLQKTENPCGYLWIKTRPRQPTGDGKKSSNTFLCCWLLIFFQLLLTKSFEQRDVMGCCFPDNFPAHAAVIMRHQIAHSLDCCPRHTVRCGSSVLRGQSAAQLPYLKNAKGNRALVIRVFIKDIKRAAIPRNRFLYFMAVVINMISSLQIRRQHTNSPFPSRPDFGTAPHWASGFPAARTAP